MSRNVGEFDDYLSNYLKAEHVKDEEQPFVCIGVNDVGSDDEPRLQLELVTEDEREWMFDLNKTNIKKLKEEKLTHPKQVIGKRIYFMKVKVNNPQTKKEVDGLRIKRIS